MSMTKLARLLMDHPGMQYRVAVDCGFHPNLMSAYKLGKREIPIHHAVPMCEWFHVELSDLTGWVEEAHA